MEENQKLECVSSLSNYTRNEWGGNAFNATPMDFDLLDGLEKSKINNLKHYYIRLSEQDETIARANLYKVKMDFSSTDRKLDHKSRKTIKTWYPDFMEFTLLECGYFTMIGQGLEVKNDNDLPRALNAVVEKMEMISKDDKEIDFLMFRDIPVAKYETFKNILIPQGFLPVLGFPNAVLPIKWKSIDEYLTSLNSKTRLKFKNSLDLKKKFNIDYEFISNFGTLKEVLAKLWGNVNQGAQEYSREILDEKFFECCSQYMDGKSEILLFKHEGKPIAFMLNIIGKDDYIVLDWGVDYSFEHYRKANLYRAATVLSLKRAIELNKSTIEFGITNYTPKMTLGADIEPLVYFIKHRDNPNYTNVIAKLMSFNIVQPDNSMHSSVTRSQEEVIDIPQLEKTIQRDQDALDSNDIFLKVNRYYRSDAARLAGIYGLYPEFKTAQQSSVRLNSIKNVVLLGTNSYLCAGTNSMVVESAINAIKKYGTGCSGSPLLNGTLDIHNHLERELAEFMNRESVILCSTGYQTNMAGIAGLCGVNDLIIMDARNHRSLFDGAKLSGADVVIYRHNDMKHLERILRANMSRRKMIITDSVFSMEGEIADLKSIAKLAKQYMARLFVDESHAIGVLGANGRGVVELLGVEKDVDIVMATFSKSFASIGGFLAGDLNVIDYVKHNAGAHIFSASLPAPAIATARAVLRLIKEHPEMRKAILDKAEFMAENLQGLGYRAEFKGTQIVPVVFGNYSVALSAYKKFMDSGVYVNPVGPPAVPEESSGFRTSYIANHAWGDLERALDIFDSLKSVILDIPSYQQTIEKAS